MATKSISVFRVGATLSGDENPVCGIATECLKRSAARKSKGGPEHADVDVAQISKYHGYPCTKAFT